MKKILAILALVSISGCSYSNLDYVKENAKQTLADANFEITGYEGYQFGLTMPATQYGGAKVWYTVAKLDNGITYNLYLQRWGNEIHIYRLSAVDAIKP